MMRAAEARVAMLDALEGATGEARRVYSRIAVPRTYLRAGMAAGAGVAGVWLLRKVLSGVRCTPSATPSGVGATGAGAALMYLLVQAASAILLPWIRSRVQHSDWSGMWHRMHPTQILFRWLGLEK